MKPIAAFRSDSVAVCKFLGGRLSLRPEIRIVDSTIRSRSNLGLMQMTIAVGYRW